MFGAGMGEAGGSFESCCQQCKSKPGCAGFAYKGGHCWFKGAAGESDAPGVDVRAIPAALHFDLTASESWRSRIAQAVWEASRDSADSGIFQLPSSQPMSLLTPSPWMDGWMEVLYPFKSPIGRFEGLVAEITIPARSGERRRWWWKQRRWWR